jgi:hypothetical protein
MANAKVVWTLPLAGVPPRSKNKHYFAGLGNMTPPFIALLRLGTLINYKRISYNFLGCGLYWRVMEKANGNFLFNKFKILGRSGAKGNFLFNKFKILRWCGAGDCALLLRCARSPELAALRRSQGNLAFHIKRGDRHEKNRSDHSTVTI